MLKRNQLIMFITVLAVLLLGIGTSSAQNEPISKASLMDALKQLKRGDSQAAIVKIIQSRGVDFELTEDVRRELTRAGASAELIDAIRNNYRPTQTPTPAPVSTPTPTPTPKPRPSPPRTPHANFAGRWTEDKSGQTNPSNWYLIWEVKQTDAEITISSTAVYPDYRRTDSHGVTTFNLEGQELTTQKGEVEEVRSASWHDEGRVLELLTVMIATTPQGKVGGQEKQRWQIVDGVLKVTSHAEWGGDSRDTTAVFRRHINRP
jgi:hypothetical protein